MDSNHDDEARIALLESELDELRGARPKATRIAPQPAMPRRRLPALWIAASLFALSLPVAAYVDGEARDARMSEMQRRALDTEARLSLAERRHEVATRFLDVALDPDRNAEDRTGALRYLADQLDAKSKLRGWARNELADEALLREQQAERRQADERTVHDRRVRDDLVKLFDDLQRNKALQLLVRGAMDTDRAKRHGAKSVPVEP